MIDSEGIFKLTEPQLKDALENDLRIMSYQPVNMDGFLYAKGTIPVLLVAHLDTVHKTPVNLICKSHKGTIWMSPQGIGGDDRCGVWIILELIKSINCSVLFCEQEEVGGAGAKKFVQSGIRPEVNYIVEFDRKGVTDAVFYDNDNKEFEKFITDGGFKTQYGSFSDISVIAPALGISAVNLSSGYDNPHTIGEYINFKVMRKIVYKAEKLITTKTKMFKYIPAPIKVYPKQTSLLYPSYYDDDGRYWGGGKYEYGTPGTKYYGGSYNVKDVGTYDKMCMFDGYVVKDGGKIVSEDGFGFMIDAYGGVYEEIASDLTVYRPDYTAKGVDGQPAMFHAEDAEHIEWITEDDLQWEEEYKEEFVPNS